MIGLFSREKEIQHMAEEIRHLRRVVDTMEETIAALREIADEANRDYFVLADWIKKQRSIDHSASKH